MRNILYTIRGMYQRAKEAFLIIPVVYKTMRWDYTSIFIILEHWLGRMQQAHEQDKWHTKDSVNRNVKNIKICKELCKRIYEDKYVDSFHDEHDQRWGKAKYWFTPVDHNCSTWNHSRPNAIYAHDKAQERKEYKKWILEHPEYLQNQDMDYLFRLLKKHVRHWWI